MTIDVLSVTLITVVPTGTNANGYPTVTEYTKSVMAEKISVSRAEFYEAFKAGIKPTAMYRIFPHDFTDACKTVSTVLYEPEYLTDNSIRYAIIRTYQKNPDVMELTCAKVT